MCTVSRLASESFDLPFPLNHECNLCHTCCGLCCRVLVRLTAPLHQVVGRRTTTRPMTPLLQTAPKPRSSSSSSRRQHLRHFPQPQLLWRLAAVLVLVHRVTPALRGAPQHRHHLQRGQGQGLQQQTAQHSQVGRVAA
jgi:hypothetical protein